MHKKPKCEFSKTLLKQESALIWIISLAFLFLAFYCIYRGYTGTLPWLAAMVGFPWTAYGVSQACYYKKSEKENTTGGVKYESVILEAKQRMIESQYVTDFSDFNINEYTNNSSNNPDDYQI